MFYSISYYRADKSFAYVGQRTFQKLDQALISALMHLQKNHDQVHGASVVYQGKSVQKAVRYITLYNLEPNYK